MPARWKAAQRKKALGKFGDALADRRYALGISQEELGHRCGLHRNYIGYLERGETNPTVLTLLALAEGLECRPSDLLRTPFS